MRWALKVFKVKLVQWVRKDFRAKSAHKALKVKPDLKVLKSLNTVSAPVMVNPGLVGQGDHTIFVCGNDAAAKAHVTEILTRWFGWRDVLDLGDISTARGPEMYLPLWLRLWGALATPMLNVKVVR